MEHGKPHPNFKVWMETDDGYVFGPGVYSLLKKIMEVGTLKEASIELGMSYRYAWGLIRKAEEKLGEPLLSAHKGGKSGGGGAELTESGKRFLKEFENISEKMKVVSKSSSRFLVSGTVREVKSGQRDSEIIVRIDQAEAILLRKGDRVSIVKGE
jgi:molybdate transport system regulatory protein